MKRLLLVLVFVVISALIFNFSALAGRDSQGPAPNSGDGISDGSGMDGQNGNSGGFGPAPSSGDGVSDGSGLDGPNGDGADGDDGDGGQGGGSGR